MISFLRRMFGQSVPADEYAWHVWTPIFPVRLIDGRWSRANGEVWRRRGLKGYEYKQDAETGEEYFDERGW